MQIYRYVQVLLAAILVHAAAPLPIGAGERPMVGHDIGKLPAPVREMRDRILASVRSGDINELKLPIQWNEIPPDFGTVPAKDIIAEFRKRSVDGAGRQYLAILGNLLSAPYAIVREGPDIENNQVFIWPYLARVAFKDMRPEEKVLLLSICPPAVYKEMQKTGRYGFWTISIGADGTWHSFRRSLTQPEKTSEK